MDEPTTQSTNKQLPFAIRDASSTIPSPPQICVSLHITNSLQTLHCSLKECCKQTCTNCDICSVSSCNKGRFNSLCCWVKELTFQDLCSTYVLEYCQIFPFLHQWAFNLTILYSLVWHYFDYVVLCGWRGVRSTYDWQAKAIPQMGRQRNTPSQRTTLTCPSHQPLSSPCLNEDSTIWGEGGGEGGELQPKPNEDKWRGEYRGEEGGCTNADGSQTDNDSNEWGEKTRENEERETTKRHDRKPHTEQKTCHSWKSWVMKVIQHE